MKTKNELNDKEELEEHATAVKEVYFPGYKTTHDDSYREIDRSQFEYIV
jgi:hypothetical protein